MSPAFGGSIRQRYHREQVKKEEGTKSEENQKNTFERHLQDSNLRSVLELEASFRTTKQGNY